MHPPDPMPSSPADTVRKDVLYPDDLPGEGLVIREMMYWDASDDEDAQDLPDDAQWGHWLPVHRVGEEDEELWASAPRDLREQLLDLGAEEGDAFEVTMAERGDEDHDPWVFEVLYPYEP